MERLGRFVFRGEKCAGSGKKNFAHMGPRRQTVCGFGPWKILDFPGPFVWEKAGRGIVGEYKLV